MSGKKPSRRVLLRVVGECQSLFGQLGAAANDRNPNRAADIDRIVREGCELCVRARSFDAPDDAPSGLLVRLPRGA